MERFLELSNVTWQTDLRPEMLLSSNSKELLNTSLIIPIADIIAINMIGVITTSTHAATIRVTMNESMYCWSHIY